MKEEGEELTDGPGGYGAEESPPLHVRKLHGEGEVGDEVAPCTESSASAGDDEDDPVRGEGVAKAERKLTWGRNRINCSYVAFGRMV